MSLNSSDVQYVTHLRDCCCGRWRAGGPTEGGNVAGDLSELVTDVAGLTEVVA